MLKATGALWIVSRKGEAAAIKDAEVMTAAKAAWWPARSWPSHPP
jgi:hypothetical protein